MPLNTPSDDNTITQTCQHQLVVSSREDTTSSPQAPSTSADLSALTEVVPPLDRVCLGRASDTADVEDLPLRPCVPMYHPSTIQGLRPGKVYRWCTCGLSKRQPWCDGKSHVGTRFRPLEWTVPNHTDAHGRTRFSICNCKYTLNPPLCDGTHYDLPLKYLAQIRACKVSHDPQTMSMCDQCGWRPTLEERPASQPSTDSDTDTGEGDDHGERQ